MARSIRFSALHDKHGKAHGAIAGDSSYNPVTQTADSQEIPADCIFQFKLTAGKASGKLFDLLTLELLRRVSTMSPLSLSGSLAECQLLQD